jgi:hypothetical protein
LTTLKELVAQKLEFEELEDIDEETLRDTLEGLEGTLYEKINAICSLLGEWQMHADGITAEQQRLADRKRVFQNKKGRLKDYLQWSMERLNNPKIVTDLYTVRIQKGNMRVCIEDESIIPEDFIHTEIKINRTDIRRALVEEECVPGAKLERGEPFLVIK